MFSFFKRKASKIDLSGLKVDMHSHLLPGIDDGSPDTDTSVELTRGLIEMGYEKFIVTPHILSDMYRNNPKTIRDAQDVLMPVLESEGINVPFHAAAEYYMDEHFDDLVSSETPLLTLKNNWVLVEFSFVSPPLNLKEKLFDLQIHGYQPVIAHPERYVYLSNNKGLYDEIRHIGCLFQLNLLSLTGYYGRGAFDLAQHLIKKEYVDLLGTDMHHIRHLQTMRNSPQLNSQVQELLDTGKILNSTL